MVKKEKKRTRQEHGINDFMWSREVSNEGRKRERQRDRDRHKERERDRHKERDSLCVCVCKRKKERDFVCLANVSPYRLRSSALNVLLIV